MMPGWRPVVWITLLSSGMLSNFQVRVLTFQMCKYAMLCDKLSPPWVYFTDCKNLYVGVDCLSFEMTRLQSGESVLLPSWNGNEQWIPLCCRQELHSGCAADFT